MTLQARDRRALAILGAATLVAAAILLWPERAPEVVGASAQSIPAAERRLQRLREIAGTVPERQKVVDGIAAQVKQREKGLLEAETGAQAQAQLTQIVRKLARAQSPPVEIGQIDMGPISALGGDYGEALVSMSMNCRIEQLVNLLADISAQPEAIATHDLRITAGDQKQKMLNVRMSVSGVLPKRLAPTRPGASGNAAGGGTFF